MRKRTVVGIVVASIAAIGSSVWFAAREYDQYTRAWQLKQKAVDIQRFRARESVYQTLLANWNSIVSAPCGGPDPSPGFVAFYSLTREPGEKLTVETNSGSRQNASIEQAGEMLRARPESVRAVVEALGSIDSPEVIQSGAELRIISAAYHTHGYLHVDPSCQIAKTIEFWSHRSDNFTPGQGNYVGLESLGGGWYYFVEQR